MKRLITIIAALSLFGTPAFAQTTTDLQARLLESVTKTKAEITRAVERFNAGDDKGGCADLRAASADTTVSIGIAEQILAAIRTDKVLTDSDRATRTDEMNQIHATFLNQKSRMEAQVTSRCS